MPEAFVDRWPQLSGLLGRVSRTEDELVRLAGVAPPLGPTTSVPMVGVFRPKSDEEYSAVIWGGVQRRSRNHERLVKEAADFFHNQGASISNPHPIDLLMVSPVSVIFEAKLVGECSAGFAIREAVGQLLEYRYFIGPKDAELCIVLDQTPPEDLIAYVELALGFQIMWCSDNSFSFGVETLRKWSQYFLNLQL